MVAKAKGQCRRRWRRGYPLCPFALLLLLSSRHCFAFVSTDGDGTEAADDVAFPPLIEADDISFFFSTYDLEGLHWALTNIFHRSARNPNFLQQKVDLPQALVARGGGDTYTTEYKLTHDLEQAMYLVKKLEHSDPTTATYLSTQVIPIYEQVLQNIPRLEELGRTKGLYAFTQSDYALGIGNVYNKVLYMTTADELAPGWKANDLLNSEQDWDGIQRDWFGESLSKQSGSMDATPQQTPDAFIPGILVIDDLLTPQTLSLLRELLLRNTHWFQTKTPLEFGKYVGSYIDDGLNDPIFLELAKQLHQSMPRIMKDHHLRYLWAYKYDSEWESGINLHADQAAVNVNMWLSLEGADLEEEDYGGGLVVFTAKPPRDWDFESYNTNTDLVVEKLLKPTNFANVTVRHRPNRAVIFDSALFHQTDRYRFKKGYENGRINLTLLFGEMQKGEESAKQEL